AFRATYLPPEQADIRPNSIGKAIPNAEVLVLREDGSECAPNEPGELVQRGPLVAMGYWNDAEKTAERFRPLPAHLSCRCDGLVLPEIAVFSGDTVRRDEEGYFYSIGRRDEMIKTSGYRVSPTEIEEVLYATRMVGECVAFGMPDPALGQVIHVVVTPVGDEPVDPEALLAECRARMPAYMVPARVEVREGPDRRIKTSGYRVSPTEIEEVLYATRMVGECVAFGMPDPALGQVIHVVVTPVGDEPVDPEALLAECRARMPAYMVPARVEVREG